MQKRIKWIMAVTAAAALIPLSLKASTLTLVTAGASGTRSGATFSLTPIQPTGTGVIDPFLRIQQGQGVTSPTAGYNVNNPGNSTMQDLAGIWTHTISVGNVGTVTINGVLNYQFLLDANQTGSNPRLTLSDLQVFVSPNAPAAGIGTASALNTAITGAGGQRIFNLGNNNDVDFAVQNIGGPDPFGHGSGSGDMYVYIPVASGVNPNWFLTLYSQFGDGTYPNNDGFEEWATVNVHQVPDASATLMLLGMGLVGLEGLRRKFLI